MTIYAQHGYGKSTKVEDAISREIVDGIVLGPRDETPDAVTTYAEELRGRFNSAIQILFDPQFYACTVAPARVRHLARYDYFKDGLNRRYLTQPTNVASHVKLALSFQEKLDVDKVITPTVLIPDLGSAWAQIALSFGIESISASSAMGLSKPLLASLAIDEVALSNRGALDEFLDEVTTWDVSGFYVVIATERGYPAKCDEQRLANLLYLCYVLADQNNFDVVVGYADLVGLLLQAVGVNATATGWFNSLRQFSMSRFEPVTGGGAARARYTSSALLNSILLTPEFDGASRVQQLARVFSDTSYDAVLRVNPSADNWPADRSCLHHWEVLSRTGKQVSSGAVPNNLDVMMGLISAARENYRQLQDRGVPFELASGPRNLSIWEDAISLFRRDVGI